MPQEYKELRSQALQYLSISDPAEKCRAVSGLREAYLAGSVALDSGILLSSDGLEIPGRPDRPELVNPGLVKRRSMATVEGRAVLIHALAHIEFNAINLALDAIWRFRDMPQAYYEDWLKVAAEEAYHYDLLNRHLQSQGYAYGDFPAHNSLWEMVEKTTDSILARMALVPRTMESRGLDALPPIQEKLEQAHDQEAVRLLQIILNDEVGHVEIGNRWFNYECQKLGLDPIDAYAQLVKQYEAPKLRGPFNYAARKAAGFTEAELAALDIHSDIAN
ncbi:MAG: ferritin-like domain-containing protein [Polynucleobacter sp.]|nr:MAG: ferritin-like domain-containing protein [Polynucleobacter sp.]